jgi:hypothetical protein
MSLAQALRGFVTAQLVLAPLAAQQATTYAADLQRARAIWFQTTSNAVASEVGVSFAPRQFDDATRRSFENATAGTRWPLAERFWPEFACFTEVEFGSVRIPAGSYALLLVKTADGFGLGLLDGDKLRKDLEPPGVAANQPLLATIPMQSGPGNGSTLQLSLVADGDDGRFALVVQFGLHRFHTVGRAKGTPKTPPIVMADARSSWRLDGPAVDGKAPFAVLDHGLPRWTKELHETWHGLRPGTTWRLGKDWATTLDTNRTLLLGGKELAPGLWHLSLAKTPDGWNLNVTSAVADYRAKIDPRSGRGSSVLSVPMRSVSVKPACEELRVQCNADGAGFDLAIQFGLEELTVPFGFAKQ